MPTINSFYSIRFTKINYYAIKYFLHGEENSYFIVCDDANSALDAFFEKQKLAGYNLTHADIIVVKEIEVLNPN
jgi:hypothetical protein